MGFLKRFIDKLQAFRVAKQAGMARDLAELKKGTRVKRERSTKVSYQPGTLGLSQVSAAIKKDNGRILSRRERREIAKNFGVPAIKYYNN